MGTIYSPLDVGFDQRMHAIDRCQIELLRSISHEAGDRLLVKGGMAMRAAFGSMRLTKDIDFDRVDSMSTTSVKGSMRAAMKAAASKAGLRDVVIDVTKDTETTTRVRLAGRTHTGEDLRFETEISGRSQPTQDIRQVVQVVPPTAYAIAPFSVHTYTLEAITVQKISAVLADVRNVPRDIYDLQDLIASGADPVALLCSLPPDKLDALRKDTLSKLSQITWDMAVTHLLPYIPKGERELLNEGVWEGYILTVSEKIDAWISAATAGQAKGAEPGAAPNTPSKPGMQT